MAGTQEHATSDYFAAALLYTEAAHLLFSSILSHAVTCSNHRRSHLLLLGQRMASKSKIQPATRRVLHTSQLRDQMGNNTPRRKSMLIGALGRTQKGVWVLFNQRPGMDGYFVCSVPFWTSPQRWIVSCDYEINKIASARRFVHFKSQQAKEKR